jgi:TonB-dependent SusC/RagA subfamily outer membrane receptor
MHPRSVRVVCSLFAISLMGSIAAAQTGVVSGAIYDETNKAGLAGVTVRVPGTALVATTGKDGRFTLAGIPAGVSEIEAIRTGYQPYKLSRLRVVESDTSFIYLALAAEQFDPAAGIPVRTTTSLGPISENAPMVIVDGVVLFAGSMPDILPEKIESIEVVKGAAAAALYGERAANGVILVKTKR